MRFFCLNTYGGVLFNQLIDFIKENLKDVDIFCFQEIFYSKTNKNFVKNEKIKPNLFQELEKELKDFDGYYFPFQDGLGFNGSINSDISFGVATFLKKNITLDSIGGFFTFGERNKVPEWYEYPFPSGVQFATFLKADKTKKYTVCNFHGIPSWPKTDTPERLNQSSKIINFLNNINGEKILCGDFNLLPETKSLIMFEDAGMKNLIKEYNVTSTRNKFKKFDKKISDYVFVSNNVNVSSFKVPDVFISDHLPMIFEIQ